MVCRYIHRITHKIVHHLTPKYVRFPQTNAERTIIKNNFLARFNLPGILGIVDGTHVGLAALPHDIELAFVNRKGYHSINVQLVCDSEMIITNVNARYPGSTHDSHVFNNSRLHTLLENLHHNQPNERNFLIGIKKANILI